MLEKLAIIVDIGVANNRGIIGGITIFIVVLFKKVENSQKPSMVSW